MRNWWNNLTTGKKIAYPVLLLWILGIVFFVAVWGLKPHKAPEVVNGFSPTDEFKLDTWFKVGPIAFNKAVLYVLLTVAITSGVMVWISKRLQRRPGRLQAAVESFYNLCQSMAKDNIAEQDLLRKYFPLIATLFIFILVTNLIGYIPLPVNSTEKFNIAGVHIPSFQIYAADTNVGFPLILALGVFVIFNVEGVRHHGPIGYLGSLMPSGVGAAMTPLIFGIEILSVFLRLISLTVRLWANLLAGHLLIAFMSGELGVLVGDPYIAWALMPLGIAIYLFEAVLIAGLQAFIFAILTAIYIGGAVESH
jgi:F-type H+-transporting ATPase subunit a